MNPWDLSAADLLVFGIVLHLIADWPLQNDWMAANKAKRRMRWGPDEVIKPGGDREGRWWDRHPAAYCHAAIHGVLLALVFGWIGAPLALVHLIIDTRAPVVWWSKLMRQTQPTGAEAFVTQMIREPAEDREGLHRTITVPVVDIGLEVRFWTDQVFHIACIAVAAIVVTL